MPGSDGRIYLLTHGGNFIYDPVTGRTEDWMVANDISGLSGTADNHGNIWFADEESNLFKYLPGTDKLLQFKIPAKSYLAVWSMYHEKGGSLLLGTSAGIFIKDVNNTENPLPEQRVNAFTQFTKSTVYHMLETEEGIWLSTDNGLFLYDTDKGIMDQVDETYGLPNKDLFYLHIDSFSPPRNRLTNCMRQTSKQSPGLPSAIIAPRTRET